MFITVNYVIGISHTLLKATQKPLASNPVADARNPMRNFQVRSPSRVPPGAIGLATPFLRHLVRPRTADKMEMT